MNPTFAAGWINRANIMLNIILVIWATTLIGLALPEGHRYEGGWIFGLAWFPIVLFATIQIVTASSLPQKLLSSLGALLLPYLFVAVNLFFGHDASPQSFIVQSAMLQFTTCIVAFALQATVFPVIAGDAKHVSNFIQEEAFPQLFGASLGLILSYFAFSFLLSEHIIASSDLPLLFLGILVNGIILGRTLYQARIS